MEDEHGGDEKLLAVPSAKLTQRYAHVNNYSDLPSITIQQIEHFFAHYKDLEPDKWVKIIALGRRRRGSQDGARGDRASQEGQGAGISGRAASRPHRTPGSRAGRPAGAYAEWGSACALVVRLSAARRAARGTYQNVQAVSRLMIA